MIRYQLRHTKFDQILIMSMRYTCMKSYPQCYKRKQLIKILSSRLRKLDGCFFLKFGSEMTVRKNSKQTLPQVEKVTVQKLAIGFRTVTSSDNYNVGWFLLRGLVVDLLTICYLSSRNHSNIAENKNLTKS